MYSMWSEIWSLYDDSIVILLLVVSDFMVWLQIYKSE